MMRSFLLTSALGFCAALSACSEPAQTQNPSSDIHAADTTDSHHGAASEVASPEMTLADFMDCARQQSVTLISAHRAGPRAGVAENSLSAISASSADGAYFFEIDVRQSADGTLFLLHDDTLDRTTNGEGTASEQNWAELSQLTLVDNEGQATDDHIPTLAEALGALDGVGIAQLDIKGVDPDIIVAGVREAGAEDRVLLISYTIEQALTLHHLAPEMMLSAGMRDEADLEAFKAANVDLTRIVTWLGLGQGNPEFDAHLAAQGIETSYADFRAEQNADFDYVALAQNGAEIISVDNVPAASAALEARSTLDNLLAHCPA